ncbi:MAG TPA: winged helix-turn-helix domain-containing protein [Rhizomicrobium sp.]|jgi:TolB-like protein|nr:winged helix-turn-helix domain-containing protein [Rhizomicrobium sp.]
MNFRPNLLKPVGPNALAQEADFEIGPLRVSPSRLEISAGDRRETTQPRVMQVFVMMAGAKGTVVSRDELIGQCWSGRIVGEDAISRCVAKVREIANLASPPAFEIETIPRVGYRLKPAAMMAAASARPVSTAGNTVLAVLAFDNLSRDADLDFFSEGVSEEILQTVARTAELIVIGRSSSFQFRGADKAAARVASVLKATHVLDGAVRRSGNRVRISASLIECAGETTLWSNSFDRELSDVFALQDEIAAAVAAALKVALLSVRQREAVDKDAYDFYLKALELRHEGLQEDTRLAVIGLLEKSTELAPEFARAWAFLATMQASRLRFDALEGSVVATRAQIVRAAETALRLDPGLGGAYQALGYLKPFASFDERGALHQKALAVSPNDPTVLTSASFFFAETGRMGEALGFSQQAYRLDPMNPWVANWYANVVDYVGRLEEGRKLWKSFCAQWPDNELILWNAGAAAAARRDWRWFDELAAVADRRKFCSPTLRRHFAYGAAQRIRGADAQARASAQARETLRETGTLPLRGFILLHRLGLADEAFALVEQASFAFMVDPDRCSPNGAVDDGLIFGVSHNSQMMRDARFVRLCAKLGLCDYWVKTGNWPDCAQAVAPHYDFKDEARRLVAVSRERS